MSAVTSASLCWTSLSLCFLFVSAVQKIITAESGQNVTLPCRAPNNNIIVVEWSRADLGDEYVLLYRNEQLDPSNQHPSFKNRVDLQDRQMKDGDVSLILKDVTINDTGTYECRVIMRGTNRRKRANLVSDPISIIYLHVVPPGQTGGNTEDGGKVAGGMEAGGKETGGMEAGSVGLKAVHKIITAESGQNDTLTCRAPNNNIIVVEWSRADLGDEYVLLYRDGHFHSDNQHPSFKNRVDLQDRQMKDGDVSLILKDVTINDTGTYECRVLTNRWKRAVLDVDPISIIYLHVDPPGQTRRQQKDGSVGLITGIVGAIGAVGVGLARGILG